MNKSGILDGYSLHIMSSLWLPGNFTIQDIMFFQETIYFLEDFLLKINSEHVHVQRDQNFVALT